ncbi:MAG: flavin reductase family protein [Candidatus Izemoplasmataceae bacterium]
MIDQIHTHSALLLKQLPKGVFITVKANDTVNTMTIAWGHIGVIWGKAVFIAYVRYSRYTYDLLLNAKDFTINVPNEGELKEALKIAGTKSGRDINKFKEAKLTQKKATLIDTPLIKECPLNYECKIIYSQTLEPALINEAITKRYYPNHDTHIAFYGEIVAIDYKETVSKNQN